MIVTTKPRDGRKMDFVGAAAAPDGDCDVVHGGLPSPMHAPKYDPQN